MHRPGGGLSIVLIDCADQNHPSDLLLQEHSLCSNAVAFSILEFLNLGLKRKLQHTPTLLLLGFPASASTEHDLKRVRR